MLAQSTQPNGIQGTPHGKADRKYREDFDEKSIAAQKWSCLHEREKEQKSTEVRKG